MEAIVQNYQQHLKNYVIEILQTLPLSRNFDFHIVNGLKSKHISEVNKVRRGFLHH